MDIFEAARSNNVGRIRELMGQDATLANRRDEDGNTPLYAAADTDAEDAARFLLDHGAGINSQNNDREVPLHYAASGNAARVVQLFMDYGAAVEMQNHDGNGPLHRAADANAAAAARLLLENGANINTRNKFGETPLHYAVDTNADKAMQLLLDRGAHIDAQNRMGETPLHVAVAQNRQQMAYQLVGRGASLTLKNSNGLTAVEISETNCQQWTLLHFVEEVHARGLLEEYVKDLGKKTVQNDDYSQTKLSALTRVKEHHYPLPARTKVHNKTNSPQAGRDRSPDEVQQNRNESRRSQNKSVQRRRSI